MKSSFVKAVLFVLSLGLISCGNELNESVNNEKSKVTIKIGLDGDSDRRIAPDIDFSSFTFTLKAECQENKLNSFETVLEYNKNSGISISLVRGTYNFTLEATKNDVTLKDVQTGVIIDVDSTALNFNLKGEGNGTVNYSFKVDEKEWVDGVEPSVNDVTWPEYTFKAYSYDTNLKTTLSGNPTETKTFNTDDSDNYKQNIKKATTGYRAYYYADINFELEDGKYFVLAYKNDNLVRQDIVIVKGRLNTTSDYVPGENNTGDFLIVYNTNGGNFNGKEADYGFFTSEEDQNQKYKLYCSKNPSGEGNEVLPNNVKLPLPSKTDDKGNYYNFLGWYYNQSCTNPVDGKLRGILEVNKAANSNIVMYAKWSDETVPAVPLYTLSEDEKVKPDFSANWTKELERAEYATSAIALSGTDLYSFSSTDKQIYKNNQDSYITADFSNCNVKKMAVDEKNNNLIVLLYIGQRYSFSIINLNSSTASDVSLPEDINISDVNSIAAYNNVIYCSYSDNNYKNKICSIKLDNNIARLEKDISFNEFLPDGIYKDNEIFNNSYISDLVFDSEGNLYASMNCFYINSDYSVKTDNKIYSFGEIFTVDTSKLTCNNSIISDISQIDKKELETSNSDYCEYIGVDSCNDTKILTGPTRMFAIKPKTLAVIDQGVYAWVDNDFGRYFTINRIVIVDLENNSVEHVGVPYLPFAKPYINYNFENVNFPDSFPDGFSDFYSSAYSLFKYDIN